MQYKFADHVEGAASRSLFSQDCSVKLRFAGEYPLPGDSQMCNRLRLVEPVIHLTVLFLYLS